MSKRHFDKKIVFIHRYDEWVRRSRIEKLIEKGSSTLTGSHLSRPRKKGSQSAARLNFGSKSAKLSDSGPPTPSGRPESGSLGPKMPPSSKGIILQYVYVVIRNAQYSVDLKMAPTAALYKIFI